ncbi:MAG: aldehyde dehydrogenase family protein [Alphaproteobacteria bacterium]|nr:aldehyde dehydrogenase family protein [Alphaproteobacteria bacterium]
MVDGRQANFVAGKWVASDEVIDNINPATGESFAAISMAGLADLERSVAAAQRVHESRLMYELAPHKRAAMLHSIADALNSLKPDGARLLCLESGKRLRDAEDEFDEAVRYFRYYSGIADKLEGRSIPLGSGYIDYTVHVPYGVTAHIVPWNFPLSIAARSLAPALATANTAVVKVPELAPMAALLLGRACEMAEVPEGAVSILCGSGPLIGGALVNHPSVQQVAFTGSVPVGQKILADLAHRVVPSVVELGGKSAGIVARDANMARVLDSIYWGIFFNAGQVCSALSRLIVPREMQDEIVGRIEEKIAGFSVGNGLENHDITPVISEAHQERVLAAIDGGISQDGRLVCGGHRLNRAGYFVAPTIFADVDVEMTVAQKEIFGPVLVVQPYDRDEEALAIANGTDFGLAAGIFTQDIDRAGWFSDRLNAGQIYVNEWYAGGVETPFGGTGMSGNGRDKGQEAIFNYVHTRNVAIRLA